MSLSRDSRQERKLKALMRAQMSLKQRFERIDWEEDVLLPEIEKMKAGHPVLGLEAGAAFDIQVEDAPSSSSGSEEQSRDLTRETNSNKGRTKAAKNPRLRHRK